MPINPHDYPDNWRQVSLEVRERAGGRCEGPPGRGGDPRCEAVHGQLNPVTGARVYLTVAHLNGPGGPCQCRPLCADPRHLLALCQRCHLNYDRPKHVARARARRRAARAVGDLFA